MRQSVSKDMRIPGVQTRIKGRELSIEGKDNQDEIRNPSTEEQNISNLLWFHDSLLTQTFTFFSSEKTAISG